MMKKIVALFLALMMISLSACAFAQTVEVSAAGCTLTLPDDMEEFEPDEEDMVLWMENSTLALAVYVQAADGYTLAELQSELTADEKNLGTTTVNGVDMLYYYGDDSEDGESYSYIGYIWIKDDLLVELSFSYALQDSTAAQATADIVNTVAW